MRRRPAGGEGGGVTAESAPPRPDTSPGAGDGRLPVRPFTVGYDLGAVGAWLRVALGVIVSGYFLVDDLARLADPKTIATVAGWFLAILAAYLAAFWWLGPRVLARRSPWVGTAILYGPVLLVAYLDLPDAVSLAVGAYIAVSTLVVVFMRYGGCEVVGIPSLLLRRRYRVYCPWNLQADLADRALADPRLGGHVGGIAPRAAAAVAVTGVTWAFGDLGPLPELRWEPRLLLAAAAGVVTVLLWAAVNRLIRPDRMG